jgi:hypothetical protein
MRTPRLRRPRRRPRAIDVKFARILAAQVAAGLTRRHPDGDPRPSGLEVALEERERARTALIALGVMLATAVDDDELRATLALAQTSYVTRS